MHYYLPGTSGISGQARRFFFESRNNQFFRESRETTSSFAKIAKQLVNFLKLAKELQACKLTFNSCDFFYYCFIGWLATNMVTRETTC